MVPLKTDQDLGSPTKSKGNQPYKLYPPKALAHMCGFAARSRESFIPGEKPEQIDGSVFSGAYPEYFELVNHSKRPKGTSWQLVAVERKPASNPPIRPANPPASAKAPGQGAHPRGTGHPSATPPRQAARPVGLPSGSPVHAALPQRSLPTSLPAVFGWEGSPTKIDILKKSSWYP